MRSIKLIFTALIVIFFAISKNSSAQEVMIKSRSVEKKINIKKDQLNKMIPELSSNQNRSKSFSGTMQGLSGWKLNEEFESVTFPPDGW
ncbi:MAG: hypothetical protein IPJ45_08160 [Ignavibacteria bacterium]|nr:hypothetical protein [Ignavibacteria bacterium]